SPAHRPAERKKKAAALATAAFCFMRIALGLEYDGSRFLGWQTQPGGGAVQDALEPALGAIAGGPVGVTCAGRTDRGVHARGQVVPFDDPAAPPPSAWGRGATAALLVGEHDFSAFRSADCQAKSPLRTLHSLDIERRGERIDFVLRANAFLHHMVRNIVGTLVYVGNGKHPAPWVRDVLESRDRARAAPTFAPEGLCLEAVEYDAKWGLPQ